MNGRGSASPCCQGRNKACGISRPRCSFAEPLSGERAAKPKHIVTTASLFILINSISGIIGQVTKNDVLAELSNYWYLIAATLIGGQIGNFLNLKIFPVRILALLTASLVLFVAIRMGFRFF